MPLRPLYKNRKPNMNKCMRNKKSQKVRQANSNQNRIILESCT